MPSLKECVEGFFFFTRLESGTVKLNLFSA